MKTLLKRLVYATVASVTVLSCNNADNGYVNPMCKQSHFVSTANELDPSCKNEKKKKIHVSEMHWEETDWDYIGGGISGGMGFDPETGEAYYFINGEKMSEEDYFLLIEEWQKKYQEQQKGKRDLDIPCVVGDDAVSWVAWLTEEEIAELLEKYGELAFSDYSEDYVDGSEESGNIGMGCGR